MPRKTPGETKLSSLSKTIAKGDTHAAGDTLPPAGKSPLIHQNLFLELSDEIDTGPTRYDGGGFMPGGNEQQLPIPTCSAMFMVNSLLEG
jgi:hypothetical protein